MRPITKTIDFTDPNPWIDEPVDPGIAPPEEEIEFIIMDATGSSSSAGSASATGAAATSGSTSASPFVINISWDASVSAAPASFKNGVLAAVQYLQNQYSDPVTISIHVGYGEVYNQNLGSGALGSSVTGLYAVSYARLFAALTSDATSAADRSAIASLAASSPVSGGNYWVSTAEAKALGLIASSATSVDGYVGFSRTAAFDYNNADGVTAGTYDFNGVALHELSEVMGRMLLTGATIGGVTKGYDALDLFHYSASGVRDFSASVPGYFSVDGGRTNLASFNTASGGDAGDWSSVVTNDAFDAFSGSGVVERISAADLTSLDVIGWNVSGGSGTPTPAPAPPAAPTGVTAAATMGTLAVVQAASGLLGSTQIATFAQTGGVSGHSFSHTLGGASAGFFTMGANSTGAFLATRAAGVPGGYWYSLTVTATDTTTGGAAPAAPIDVFVGGSLGDTVNLAALVGTSAIATPSFIYGLGGADRLNGAGMTGPLWLAGGAGADTMTGGSAANHYDYGAVSDSTASAMDIITNFHTTTDTIDLTGMGTVLAYAGQITGNAVAAHAIGWQTSGGNTFVYVNTSSASEALTAANMKIELQGAVTLASGNILHA